MKFAVIRKPCYLLEPCRMMYLFGEERSVLGAGGGGGGTGGVLAAVLQRQQALIQLHVGVAALLVDADDAASPGGLLPAVGEPRVAVEALITRGRDPCARPPCLRWCVAWQGCSPKSCEFRA